MIQPLGNRVVVEPVMRKHATFYLPPETTTFVPDKAHAETTTQGIVVAVGPKVREVGVGEVIRCSDTCGHLIDIQDRRLRVIREDDIAAVL